jgi:alkanesulfonate monooxygenase SsuD/methylene tetrahydromethanopterin reductase-like flavin-dependent oxidoreductase (luciferase family)
MIEVGYGLITRQTHPDDPRGWQELYSEALELGALAESSGAESIWVSEHHFVDDGYLPASLPMMAALSAVTRTAKIGSAMVLAPFYDPLRLAEDVAVTQTTSTSGVSDAAMRCPICSDWRWPRGLNWTSWTAPPSKSRPDLT